MFNVNKIKYIDPHWSVSEAACRILYKHAKESIGHIVEIGSYYGRSTVVLAMGSEDGTKQKVFAIDPWSRKKNLYETFTNNVKQSGYSKNIYPYRAESSNAFYWKKPRTVFLQGIGLLFIDGSHGYDAVKEDLLWVQLVKSGGVVAFHDYGDGVIQGVKHAVDEYFAGTPQLTQELLKDSLLVCRKL